MIVILEGSDLTGKSTLAVSLTATHGWPVAKIRWDLLGDPEIETRAMAKTTIELLHVNQHDIIFDRIYFPGERIVLFWGMMYPICLLSPAPRCPCTRMTSSMCFH